MSGQGATFRQVLMRKMVIFDYLLLHLLFDLKVTSLKSSFLHLAILLKRTLMDGVVMLFLFSQITKVAFIKVDTSTLCWDPYSSHCESGVSTSHSIFCAHCKQGML